MDPSESSLSERQEDEVQALQAIYGEDMSVVRENVRSFVVIVCVVAQPNDMFALTYFLSIFLRSK